MLKNFSILILSCVLFVNLFETTFGNYCDSNSVVNQAFNLGTNIYLGHGSRSIWKFNPEIRRTIDRKLDLQTIFGKNSFNWIDTAFTFVFDECDPNLRSDSYCEATNKAKGIVVAIGSRKTVSPGSRRYGYLVYRINDDNSLTQFNATEDNIVWDLKGSGSLSNSFWVQMSSELNYESSIFLKSRNELIVSVFDSSSFGDPYHLMSLKLQSDGKWSEWVEISKNNFRGMFEINERAFGFDKKNKVFEFKWSADNIISFEPISNLKELLNCYENSSLWEGFETVSPLISDPLDASTPSTTTTTTTTSTSNESTNDLSSVGTIGAKEEEEDNENEIQLKTETINYETVGPDVALLTNITESSTQSAPQMNQKLEDLPQESQEESGDWSGVYVVAIILLICVIVVTLIIIVRNKSKSRIVYLNSKSDDSKSAEIPLNVNNNDKSLHSKDV